MRIVYDANNSLDAHVVKNLLETEGIEAFIQGEHLQSGVGELSAMNLVKVSVNDNDAKRAREIIEEWDARQIDSLPQDSYAGFQQKSSGAGGFFVFLAGCLVGAVITYIHYCR